jgi:hypothetical protein
MKNIFFLFIILGYYGFAQQEIPPIFEKCNNLEMQKIDSCFFSTLQSLIEKEIKIPEVVKNKKSFKDVRILFNVDEKGNFSIVYINSPYKELESEIKRVFSSLPKLNPATFNGRPIVKQYTYTLQIPFSKNIENVTKNKEVIEALPETNDKIKINDDLFPEHKSNLLIPFTHQQYDLLQQDLLQKNNQHFAIKPYIYNNVSEVIDLDSKKQKLLKTTSTWWSKKLWNEHFFMVEGKKDNIPYWFTVDPEVDLQIGKENSDIKYTFNNTRAVKIQGAIGSKFGFSASIYESQGRFADYINYFNNKNGIVIGRGKFKRFKENSFDYPAAEAYLTYSPNKIFNFQFGQGKNFIGNGYRSLFLSDVASSYPYLKITSSFWKIRYTNMWLFLDDIQNNSIHNGEQIRKYVGIHHLSYNVNSRLNLSLFETVISNNENGNNFDITYFNPIILFRVAEFNKGSKAGNALVGMGVSFKLKSNLLLYGQFLLDEMTIAHLKKQNGYWANKYAFQFGYKYFNAFGISNLFIQAEANIVRPFTYSHKKSTLNYGHFNQTLAHPWGANFYELVGIVRYQKNRWFGNFKLNVGKKGFDFDNSDDSYGGDIFISYDNRVSDFDNYVGQGNSTNILISELQAGYLINPSTNLKFFTGVTSRRLIPKNEINSIKNETDFWFTIGLKTDVFNWYTDF